jgi:hypothetical protein
LQRDLPLWARGVVGGLLVIASWWVLGTGAAQHLAGESVAILMLGVVSASSLRGMHVPLGLWPDGPWRTRFSLGIVVAVAVAFASVMVLADPETPALLAWIDRGVFILVAVGVGVWGFAWAFVRQRPAAWWYGIATAAGVAPLLAGVVEIAAAPGGLCLLGADQVRNCSGGAVRVFGFLLPVYAALSLVTIDVTFRRLLVGWPDRADAVLVTASALLFGLWVAVVGLDVPIVAIPWWVGALGAATAGALYALSGSLLVASYFTGLLFAAHMALRVARPGGELSVVAVSGWGYGAALAGVAAVTVGMLVRRRGLVPPWFPPRRGG